MAPSMCISVLMGWGSYLAMPPVVNSSSSKALYRTHLFKHNELALWYPPPSSLKCPFPLPSRASAVISGSLCFLVFRF